MWQILNPRIPLVHIVCTLCIFGFQGRVEGQAFVLAACSLIFVFSAQNAQSYLASCFMWLWGCTLWWCGGCGWFMIGSPEVHKAMELVSVPLKKIWVNKKVWYRDISEQALPYIAWGICSVTPSTQWPLPDFRGEKRSSGKISGLF